MTQTPLFGSGESSDVFSWIELAQPASSRVSSRWSVGMFLLIDASEVCGIESDELRGQRTKEAKRQEDQDAGRSDDLGDSVQEELCSLACGPVFDCLGAQRPAPSTN